MRNGGRLFAVYERHNVVLPAKVHIEIVLKPVVDTKVLRRAFYACLYSFLRYDECRTYCERYVVVEEKRVRRFNIWNHAFTGEELTDDLISAGFKRVSLYGDIAGAQCSETSKTICAAAQA
ncbi:MAG: hypothetical protein ACM3S4_03660 [Burkholderiales bacterium]